MPQLRQPSLKTFLRLKFPGPKKLNSPKCPRLCRSLALLEPEAQVGSKSAEDVQGAPFFEQFGADWRKRAGKGPVPFIPDIEDDVDTSYFSPERRQGMEDTIGASGQMVSVPRTPAAEMQRKFGGFTFKLEKYASEKEKRK